MTKQTSFNSDNPKMTGTSGGYPSNTLSNEAQRVYPERHALAKRQSEAAVGKATAAVADAKAGNYGRAALKMGGALAQTAGAMAINASMVPGTYAEIAKRAMSKDTGK